MSLVFSCISPHPPIIIPTIGQDNLDQVRKTIKAMEKLNKFFVQSNPETLVIISPHAPLFPNAFAINQSEKLQGDFSNFNDFQTSFEFENDLDLAEEIIKASLTNKIPIISIKNQPLDHGALVPLYYLTKNYPKIKIIVLSFSYLDLKTHFTFGQILSKLIRKNNKKIAVCASGDLSHRLTLNAPTGYHPDGKKFDKQLVELLKEKEVEKILKLDPNLIENAGECGLRSIIILLGILDKINYKPEILSYEGPFGVGYLVANFKL